MARILFIGTFLSHLTGTKGVSEKLMESLINYDVQYLSASKKRNQIARLFEIAVKSLFSRYSLVHIDIFSGRAFIIAEVVTSISYFRKKRIILTLRGGKLPEFYLKFPRRVDNVLKKAHYRVTPSLYLQSFFAQQNRNLYYLPNAIDLSRFPYNRENIKPRSLLWVRAFDKIYNPDLAVRTLYEIRKSYADATLTMIGPDKGLLDNIRCLIEELRLCSAVIIAGPIQNNNLSKYYQTHNVFLNTTSYESFGVAVLEAAACGIPIVSTKVGEVPYLYKHRESILMVDGFNPIDFSTQVDEIFKAPTLAENLSRSARRIAECFDWENIQPQWVELLNK
ncbi:MAG: glycosyltransferase family 4 protein [Bacteroidales bacterium]